MQPPPSVTGPASRRQFLAASAAGLAGLAARAYSAEANAAQAFAPPLPFAPDPRQRAHLARSLTLLASGTAQAPVPVRILFYGQSITEQSWWRTVADSLRATYPHARLQIENRAIGGHAAQLLVKTAEADLYPFQPDLLIFHVYGHHERYEDLIRRVRERTTADILIQTDHVTKPADLTEEQNPARLSPKQWDAWMNHQHLPAVAQRYGACLADVRSHWKRHLRDTQLDPAAFLRDSVHLNDHGCFLMAEILQRYLAPQENPSLLQPYDCPRVRTLRLTPGSGPLKLEFQGHRVDLIGSDTPGATEVGINGRPPSQWPELVHATRTSAFPQSNWPQLLQVQSEAPRVAETWTLTFLELSPDLSQGRFQLRGSVSGEDGEGQLEQRFVSRSKRVVIEPDDWNLKYCHQVFQRSLAAGATVTWQSQISGLDRITLEPGATVTVAAGLPEGTHQLTLSERRSVRAVRVYSPAGQARVSG